MATYAIEMRVAADPTELFAALRAYNSPPDSAARITRDGTTDSARWCVPFRNAHVMWRQAESGSTDTPSRGVSFEQIDGPFTRFAGSWDVTEDDGAALFRYQVAFSTSVPNWAGAIDRVLGRAVLRAMADAVSAVSGGAATLTAGGQWLADHVPA